MPVPSQSAEFTDPELRGIVTEYFRLSKRNNITFTSTIHMSIEDIGRDRVIGLCGFGIMYRKIMFDKSYWEESTYLSKVSTVYHEMTHCYCGRTHDFEEGKEYPDMSLKSTIKRFFGKYVYSPLKPEGFMDDGCPSSIMLPYSFSDKCFKDHYDFYTKEMFNRCDPW